MSDKIIIKVKGLDEFYKLLQQSGKQAPQLAGQCLYPECEIIMTDSKDKYCPVLTGALRTTGRVGEPAVEGKSVTCELSYGGPAAPYALAVHEGYPAHTITVKNKKILAAPVATYKGKTPPSAYGSGQFPMLSKDGNFVLFGKTVHNPGYKGKKYLSMPINAALPGLPAKLLARLQKILFKQQSNSSGTEQTLESGGETGEATTE
jgi:hypothetical protein